MTNKFKYIIDTFKTVYDVDKLDLDINYGVNNNSAIQITNHFDNFFDSFDNDIDLKKITFNNWKNESIPFFFSPSQKQEVIKKQNNQLIINYDIIGSSFLFLSGWLEYKNRRLDNFNRIVFQETIQHKLGISHIPVVNYYFDILKTAIEIAYDIKVHPKNSKQPFITSVSHDIDKCKSGWKEEIFYLIKKLRPLSILKIIIKKLQGEDIWFNLSDIIRFEKQNNIKSVFYFLTKKGKYKNDIYNADYSIGDPRLKKIFQDIEKNDSEIGIHGSFGTSKSFVLFNEEISVLENEIGNEILGNRFHYLQYNISNTPDILEKSKLKYDMSLGFAENIGFRNGICYPFKLYNFEKDNPYDYYEIPLIVMDVSLFNKNYMNLNFNDALEQCKSLISEIIKFNGIFTVLWHNNSFSPYKYGYRKRFIQNLIDYCILEGTVFKTPKQILSI